MEFTPRIVSWGCTACDSKFKLEECLDNGRYCAPSVTRDRKDSISGRSILYENLRE